MAGSLKERNQKEMISENNQYIDNSIMKSVDKDPSETMSSNEDEDIKVGFPSKDELVLGSAECKSLSSKERRQLRNRVSARHFRLRRKKYISELEGMVSDLTKEVEELKEVVKDLKEENARLAKAKSSSGFPKHVVVSPVEPMGKQSLREHQLREHRQRPVLSAKDDCFPQHQPPVTASESISPSVAVPRIPASQLMPNVNISAYTSRPARGAPEGPPQGQGMPLQVSLPATPLQEPTHTRGHGRPMSHIQNHLPQTKAVDLYAVDSVRFEWQMQPQFVRPPGSEYIPHVIHQEQRLQPHQQQPEQRHPEMLDYQRSFNMLDSQDRVDGDSQSRPPRIRPANNGPVGHIDGLQLSPSVAHLLPTYNNGFNDNHTGSSNPHDSGDWPLEYPDYNVQQQSFIPLPNTQIFNSFIPDVEKELETSTATPEPSTAAEAPPEIRLEIALERAEEVFKRLDDQLANLKLF